MHIVTKGVVLRETKYKEADKLLTVLTAHEGKRTVKARGCRRKGSPIAACAQLLAWSDMTLFEYKDYYTLTEGSTIALFRHMREDLDKLALGSYFAEVVETVAEEGLPQPGLLSLLLNGLYALDALDRPLPLVKAAFELRLLCEAGYAPLVDACAVCGRTEPEGAQLNLTDGALHCAACRGEMGGGISMPLTPGAVAALRHVVCGDPKRLFSFRVDEESQRQLSNAAEAFLLTQLERGFQTLDFYKRLQGSQERGNS
jgi:DNA repair protein RecO (recombination protein O)